ncbi:class I SAM-dependent methyltransferase [Tritonibacter mobilis]|nr:class I SAM-dependent methyltransferase [Tritonibacter mobilis]
MRQLDLDTTSPIAFWNDLYKKSSTQTSGAPSRILAKYVTERAPAQALDLGCAKGDDAVWLAKNGWQVLGVDISDTALRIAAENAARNGVAERTTFRQIDLTEQFPEDQFDLVSALFLQTPFDFPRALVMRQAAAAVKPSGLLLMAIHQTYASWSWKPAQGTETTANTLLQEIGLDLAKWRKIYVGPFERRATGPDGESETVKDAVIALERI